PLSPGQGHRLRVVFQAARVGVARVRASVLTAEGFGDEREAVTEVVPPRTAPPVVVPPGGPPPAVPPQGAPPPQPRIDVTLTVPPNAFVGVPLACQITLTNAGAAEVAGLAVTADFDAGLEHESRTNPVVLP